MLSRAGVRLADGGAAKPGHAADGLGPDVLERGSDRIGDAAELSVRKGGSSGRTEEPAVAIELIGVAKRFASRDGGVPAVERVDLKISQGAFFSLLGPSGCGKTTTLRMIAGLETPSSGRILIHGADVADVPPNKRDVNMVFQNYALFPHMDVFENVAYGLRRKKAGKSEIQRRVREALNLVELAGLERRRPRELSGGQQQRVALARALVNQPKALLLDEPLGALDLKLRHAMQAELKRIQREVGVTFVYVTHDQTEALTMSDQIAVMNRGLVEQVGSPAEVYERPQTRFVAGFVGVSNLLAGKVDHVTGDFAVLRAGAQDSLIAPLPEAVAGDEHRLTPGDDAELTVRPEKISISTGRPDADNVLRGVVSEIDYHGTATNYTVRTSLADLVAFCQNGALPDPALAPRISVGDAVWISWPRQHSLLLRNSPSRPGAPDPHG
jgi:spermidine/putrescine transport system ATP-binding protein